MSSGRGLVRSSGRGTARRWSALVVVAGLAACTGSGTGTLSPTSGAGGNDASGSDATVPSGGTGTAGTSSSGTSVAPAAAEALVDTFDPADAASARRLADGRADPAVVSVAGERLRAGATGHVAWAAVYVWANEGDDVALLRPRLADPDVGIRLMAAAGTIMRGDAAGFVPLVELLTSDEPSSGWIPPGPAWLTATTALVRATADATLGPPGDATPEQRALARQRWTAWLAKGPRWDTQEQRWVAG